MCLPSIYPWSLWCITVSSAVSPYAHAQSTTVNPYNGVFLILHTLCRCYGVALDKNKIKSVQFKFILREIFTQYEKRIYSLRGLCPRSAGPARTKRRRVQFVNNSRRAHISHGTHAVRCIFLAHTDMLRKTNSGEDYYFNFLYRAYSVEKSLLSPNAAKVTFSTQIQFCEHYFWRCTFFILFLWKCKNFVDEVNSYNHY